MSNFNFQEKLKLSSNNPSKIDTTPPLINQSGARLKSHIYNKKGAQN